MPTIGAFDQIILRSNKTDFAHPHDHVAVKNVSAAKAVTEQGGLNLVVRSSLHDLLFGAAVQIRMRLVH